MPVIEPSEEQHIRKVESIRRDMEDLARRLRALIITQPPLDLLSYIYGIQLLSAFRDRKESNSPAQSSFVPADIGDTQFILDYVHAVLASSIGAGDAKLSESACAEIYKVAADLRKAALFFAMASSIGTRDGEFGPNTADIEVRAKFSWVNLRGARYQVLEGEFYAFVLAPHDALLREAYGISAAEIAAGFQKMADTIRVGHARAFDTIEKQMNAVLVLSEAQGRPFEEVAAEWARFHPTETSAAAFAIDDLLYAGICNVSRHTTLPPALLADLAYERGEDSEFFAEGLYSGTPYRTLPARKKPLLRLEGNYYALDPSLSRDAGYRALLWNLLRRIPECKSQLTAAQKSMSEAAFFEILAAQLSGATIHQEVYYKDPATRQWVENDTLVIIDDVLLLIEAKSGAAATIASPALDFERHTRAVQDLVVKAYQQCNRFFNYLASGDEVPIYRRSDERYIECARIRRSDYRVIVPIGLTVESFAPFSTVCKELPGITPLLGRHPFISMSIDDLFVLKRILPTMGELAHYLEVRQAVGGMRGALLFDELDHLGAYVKKNRFDQDIAAQWLKSSPTMIVWDGMSTPIDDYFAQPDWEAQPIPTQSYPPEVLKLLGSLDRARMRGWLSAESCIRNYGDEGRRDLDGLLTSCRETLNQHPHRYFCLSGEAPLFVWLQRTGIACDLERVRETASASALAVGANDIVALLVTVEAVGNYIAAERLQVSLPTARTAGNAHVYEAAERMKRRIDSIDGTSICATAGTK